VAEDVPGVPGCQPRSQESLRLRPQFFRIKFLTDNRESRQMLQTLLWIIPLILAIGSQIVLSRYFRLWLRGYFTRARIPPTSCIRSGCSSHPNSRIRRFGFSTSPMTRQTCGGIV
jgi:hypothetical protein